MAENANTQAATPPATEAPKGNGKGKPGRKKGQKSSVPENESKPQKFIRLAKKRMPRTLKALESIGALSGSGYESTPEQQAKILRDLGAAVEAIRARFQSSKGAAKSEDYDI